MSVPLSGIFRFNKKLSFISCIEVPSTKVFFNTRPQIISEERVLSNLMAYNGAYAILLTLICP